MTLLTLQQVIIGSKTNSQVSVYRAIGRLVLSGTSSIFMNFRMAAVYLKFPDRQGLANSADLNQNGVIQNISMQREMGWKRVNTMAFFTSLFKDQ